ncbi:MAG: MFS transporter [Armatimonadota bacterium]
MLRQTIGRSKAATRYARYFIVPFVMDAAVGMAALCANLYAQDLGATELQLGLLGTAWALPYALFSPFTGRAADHLNRTLLLACGLVFTGTSHWLYSISSTPWQLILSAGLGGVGCAFFWPAFETLLHHPSPKETHSRLAAFNVGWTLGIMLGTGAAGYYYQAVGARWVFRTIAIGLYTQAMYLVLRGAEDGASRDTTPQPASHQVRSPEARVKAAFRLTAWVANFAMWFVSSGTATVFPKLARSLQISDGHIGLLSALIMVAQVVCFAGLSRTSAWHYKLTPLILAQTVSIGAVVIIAASSAPIAFAVAMALIGLGRGVSYSASLYYGLDAEIGRGGNAGIHEAVVGTAYIAGPLASGTLAQAMSLRTPFWMMSGVMAAAMLVQTGIRIRIARPSARA